MDKYDLAKRVSEKTGMSLGDARKVIDSFIHCASEELARGGRVEIRGWGVFGVKARSPSRRANPRTGELNLVPGQKVPQFRASKKIVRNLNDDKGGDAPYGDET